MEILDAQVHVWDRSRRDLPWSTAPAPHAAEPSAFASGSSVATADEMVRRMDEIGVDGALAVTSSRHYGVDNRYALEAADRHPDRFRVVMRIDPEDPAVDEQLAAAGRDDRIVGVRLMTFREDDQARYRGGGFDRVFAAAEANGVPLCLYPHATLPSVPDTARRFDGLQIVIDHLGLPQRPFAPAGSEPFRALPELLALARHPNVAVKLSAVPTCSWEPYPYAGVWPHVRRVLEAFGPERVMWGSDCTRTDGILTYAEGLRWLTEAGELSDGDLALVLGQTLRRMFGWL